MTSANETTAAAGQEPQELVPSKIMELLERLGAGERLVDAPLAMGLSQEQARAIFLRVAEIVRQNFQRASPFEQRWSAGAPIRDWSEMTVAEALEILSERAAQQKTVSKEGP